MADSALAIVLLLGFGGGGVARISLNISLNNGSKFLYPPRLCLGGYIGVNLSVGRSVRRSVSL